MKDGTYTEWGVAVTTPGWCVGDTQHGVVLVRPTDYEVTSAIGTVSGRTGYYGVWTDPKTGTTYVDPVTIVTGKRAAIALAQERREVAVFDLATATTHYIEEVA